MLEKIQKLWQKTGLFTWFFALYSIFGLITLPDYGVPLDELTQRNIGIENNRYIIGEIDAETLWNNGKFGPFFESTMYLLEQLYYNADLGVKIYVRHFILFLIFLLAIWCFYSLCKRLFKNDMVSGTVSSMLALYPLLFAHAHYNSKDTLFLSILVFILWFVVIFMETRNVRMLILGAIATGLSITLRMHGVFIMMAVVAGLMFRKELKLQAVLFNVVVFCAVTAASFYLFFPWLWENTFDHLLQLWHYVGQNPWPNPIWFAGSWFAPQELPVGYLPIWLLISIPVHILILVFSGIMVVVLLPVYRSSAFVVMILLLLALPFIAYMLLHPVMYDGWRHWQFLVIPIFMLSGFALEWLSSYWRSKNHLWIVFAYSLVSFGLWHPYGYVYMNEVYSAAYKPNTFVQDYWGLSSNQLLNYIIQSDSSSKISIYCFTEAAEHNALLLSAKDKSRLKFVKSADSANYIIETKRGPYFGNTQGQEIYSLCPLKDTISRLIKVK